MERLLLVFLAGGIGSAVRYLAVGWAERTLGSNFPWGVLGVNVVGSFLIALVAILAITKADFSPTLRITLATGFLGGLTTYSAFNQDTLAMLDRKLYGAAFAYAAAMLALCLLAGLLGTLAGRRI